MHLGSTYTSMGTVHGQQEDYPRALERYGQAAAIYEAKDPNQAHYPYTGMAIIYSRQKDYSKSLEYHRKALAIDERVHGPRHPHTATTVSYTHLTLPTIYSV